MKIPFRYLSLFFLVVNTSVFAVESESQTWGQAIVQGPMASYVVGYFEIQPRFGNTLSRFDKMMIRPGIFYKISPNWQAWVGGFYNPQTQADNTWEYRIWEQALYQTKWSEWNVLSRLRFEQRFLPKLDLAHRLRWMARFLYPLDEPQTWHIVFQNEIFFHLNKVSKAITAGFDQNRLFLGVSHQFNAIFRAEMGYLNNYISKRNTVDHINHVALIVGVVSLP